MLKNITRILPFFIVTLLSIGGVELLYGVAEHYLLVSRDRTVIDDISAVQPDSPVMALEKHTNYKVILDRNLFKSYVDEPSPEVVPVKENPLEGLQATSLDLILMGTISGTLDESSRAIIMEKAKKKQDIYYTGDVIQGAQIKEILRAKVILTYQGKDEILDMTEAAKFRPSQKAAVAPTPNRKKVISRPRLRPKGVSRSARPSPRKVPVSRADVEEMGADEDSDNDSDELIIEQDPEQAERDEAGESEDSDASGDTDADGRTKQGAGVY